MLVCRDLKPENLLYASREDDATLKLADFGLAEMLKPEESLHQACGTPQYVAPEMLDRKPYGKEVDMWSIGVILYILLSGMIPFDSNCNKDLYNKIKKGEYSLDIEPWENVSDSAKDLVRKLLIVNPAERFTAKDVLQHQWVTGVADTGSNPLLFVKPNLNSYNRRRKLKAAIRAVMMSNQLAKLAKGPAK